MTSTKKSNRKKDQERVTERKSNGFMMGKERREIKGEKGIETNERKAHGRATLRGRCSVLCHGTVIMLSRHNIWWHEKPAVADTGFGNLESSILEEVSHMCFWEIAGHNESPKLREVAGCGWRVLGTVSESSTPWVWEFIAFSSAGQAESAESHWLVVIPKLPRTLVLVSCVLLSPWTWKCHLCVAGICWPCLCMLLQAGHGN